MTPKKSKKKRKNITPQKAVDKDVIHNNAQQLGLKELNYFVKESRGDLDISLINKSFTKDQSADKVKYVCTICTKAYANLKGLKMHLKRTCLSGKDILYSCSICKCQFDGKDLVHDHLRGKIYIYAYFCNYSVNNFEYI